MTEPRRTPERVRELNAILLSDLLRISAFLFPIAILIMLVEWYFGIRF